jgi:microcystin-dependent protein
MTEPFLGQITMTSFNFAPKGYALCNGAILPINQNQALFSLFGTMYGGNGQTNFALPNLQGRVPIHVGAGHVQGESGGSSSVSLSVAQMPEHSHQVAASSSSAGGNAMPTGRFPGGASNMYHGPPGTTTLSPATVSSAGGSQPHNNMQPYQTISFCVALQGIFPSRN